MVIDVAFKCRKVDLELFRAQVFLNKPLLKKTLFILIFALVLVTLHEVIEYYTSRIGITACYICESIEVVLILYLIIATFGWRKIILRCIPEK